MRTFSALPGCIIKGGVNRRSKASCKNPRETPNRSAARSTDSDLLLPSWEVFPRAFLFPTPRSLLAFAPGPHRPDRYEAPACEKVLAETVALTRISIGIKI